MVDFFFSCVYASVTTLGGIVNVNATKQFHCVNTTHSSHSPATVRSLEAYGEHWASSRVV